MRADPVLSCRSNYSRSQDARFPMYIRAIANLKFSATFTCLMGKMVKI